MWSNLNRYFPLLREARESFTHCFRLAFVLTLMMLFGVGDAGVCFGQQSKLKPLAVGDAVPDISLGKIIHGKVSGAKFSDFKGKLLILDFWGTWCTPCVKGLSTLDAIQQHFGNKVVILPVNSISSTRDTEAKVLSFFNQHPGLSLPSVVEDRILAQLFPHSIIPHDIWIGPQGKVLAITSGEDVTFANVEKVLNGEATGLTEKKDNMHFDIYKPLLVNGNGGSDENFMYRSILTAELPGVSSRGVAPRDDKGMIRFFNFSNCPQPMLFYYAFSMMRNRVPMNVNRVFLESADGLITRYTQAQYLQSCTSGKKYCFNLSLPDGVPDSIFFRKYLLEDLNRFFDVQGRVEKKLVPALIIVKQKDFKEELILSKGESRARYNYLGGHDIIKDVSHVSFDTVVSTLREFPETPPIVNESGLSWQKVSMELNLKWQKDDARNESMDRVAVRTALNKYGLDLIEAERVVEVLILKDNK